MTKDKVMHHLLSLAIGQYKIQNKLVLVEPMTILGMRRGKRITIREGNQCISFTLLFNRRSTFEVEDIVTVNVNDFHSFLLSLFDEEPLTEQKRKTESYEILVLIFALIAIVTTPVTMVGFIMDQSWAWGTLFFLLAMVGNIIWLWRKIK